MSMLNCFFSNRYQNQSELFEGLEIWKDETYVNIEQGFQNAGIEVTTTAWLDRQEQNTSAAKAAYVQWMKEEATRKQTSEFAVMFDHPYKEPD